MRQKLKHFQGLKACVDRLNLVRQGLHCGDQTDVCSGVAWSSWRGWVSQRRFASKTEGSEKDLLSRSFCGHKPGLKGGSAAGVDVSGLESGVAYYQRDSEG